MKNPRKQLLLLLVVVGSVAALAAGRAQAITDGQLDGNGHPNVGVMVVDFGGWRCEDAPLAVNDERVRLRLFDANAKRAHGRNGAHAIVARQKASQLADAIRQ